jgi:hypothetical protein
MIAALPPPGRRATGKTETLPVAQSIHNFARQFANRPRLFLVGVGKGVSLPFLYVPFHVTEIAHAAQ